MDTPVDFRFALPRELWYMIFLVPAVNDTTRTYDGMQRVVRYVHSFHHDMDIRCTECTMGYPSNMSESADLQS